MMTRISFIFLLLTLVSLKTFPSQDMEPSELKKERLADEVTYKTAEILSKKYNLVPIGTGGSAMYDIKRLALSFNCYRLLSIEQARGLIVTCVQEYLYQINTNTEIRPFLQNYPFAPKNIEIYIYLYRPDQQEIAYGQLWSAAALNGKIYYKTPKSEYQLEVLKEETFEEALEILENHKALP
jgi:hypothetical protein